MIDKLALLPFYLFDIIIVFNSMIIITILFCYEFLPSEQPP